MPGHEDPGDLARPQLAATVSLPAPAGARSHLSEEHHGASDPRLAARQRAEQARSRRAVSAGRSRSYAFRRS